MPAVITHVSGEMESDPSPAQVAALVAELEQGDGEHSDVSIADESGWSLSAFSDGRMLWENVEDGDEQFVLAGVSRDEVVRLFCLIAAGDLEAVGGQHWVRRL